MREAYHLGMSRVRPEKPGPESTDRSVAADVLLRQESDEEEDEEEDEGDKMKREDFINVAEEILDSLPEEFRSRIQNVAILVEDFPRNQSPLRPGHQSAT